MNKKLLLTLVAFLGFLSVSAQTYHEQDKEGLRKILRQKGLLYYSVTTNFELYGLTEADTLNWNRILPKAG